MDFQKNIDALNAIIADNGGETNANAVAQLAQILRDEYAAVVNPRAAMIPAPSDQPS